MDKMWNNEEEERPSKGLWKTLQENYEQVQPYNKGELTIKDIKEAWSNMDKQEAERRKRLDETHTPIEKITLKEIDEVIAEYGGEEKVPKGLQVKVRLAGHYYTWPILAVRNLLAAIEKEA